MPLQGDGTVGGLYAAQDDAGIDYSVCLAIANEPEHVERANDYIGSIDRSRLVPFGTIHPRRSVDDNLASLRKQRRARGEAAPDVPEVTASTIRTCWRCSPRSPASSR